MIVKALTTGLVAFVPVGQPPCNDREAIERLDHPHPSRDDPPCGPPALQPQRGRRGQGLARHLHLPPRKRQLPSIRRRHAHSLMLAQAARPRVQSTRRTGAGSLLVGRDVRSRSADARRPKGNEGNVEQLTSFGHEIPRRGRPIMGAFAYRIVNDRGGLTAVGRPGRRQHHFCAALLGREIRIATSDDAPGLSL